MTTVESDIKLRIIAPSKHAGARVRVSFRYDTTDPFAVRFVFVEDGGHSWVVARSVLGLGIHEQAGIGDVQVAPGLSRRPRTVSIRLLSPDGTVRLIGNRRPIARFLDVTYGLVPEGRESAHVDIDRWLAGLLGGPNTKKEIN